MDRSAFYAALRKRESGLFGTSLSRGQVAGMEAILNEAEKRRTPLKWLAYILATSFHETAATMQPIEEYGKGKGHAYGKPGKYGQSQHGRGFVQLTWDRNYERADRELGLGGSLLKNFARAMEMGIAVQVLFQGMEHGWFTTRKLHDFIDYLPMRKIINGMDRAADIAKHAVAFETALRTAGYGAAQAPAPLPSLDTAPAKPAPLPAPEPSKPDVHGMAGLLKEIFAAIAALFKKGT
jgi:putative chitinase